MKKFSRMPKSESGGGGLGGSSAGASGYFGKVFAVGRYQVTVEELIAEGTCREWGEHLKRLYKWDRLCNVVVQGGTDLRI